MTTTSALGRRVAASDGGFRADIQGLRGIAVAAVVLYHAGASVLPGGYVGVDIFFVISGFLITSHLLSRLAASGRVGFADFYARRARRILPASLTVAALSVAAAIVWFPPVLMDEVRKGVIATALYVPNILFAIQGTDYLAESTPSLFQHYWSLGVEEQFYLIWPLVIGAVWSVTRSRRAVGAVLASLVIASFIAGVAATHLNPPLAFFLLPTRAWELGCGGLVAVALAHRPDPLGPRASAAVGWLGLAGIVWSILTFTSTTPFPGLAAALPVGATALVLWSGSQASHRGPTGLLSLRWLTFIGTISYSLYLVHWPALLLPAAARGFSSPLPVAVTLAIAVLCVPAAWLLHVLVEQPARFTPWLLRARPRRTLTLAALASVTVAALGIVAAPSGSTSSRNVASEAPAPRPSISSTAAPSVVASITQDPTGASPAPVFAGSVPAGLEPALDAASADVPLLYDNGCHRPFAETNPRGCLFGPANAPRIILFGDSHAAQWFPALLGFAQEHGYAVESFTKSGCPAVTAPVLKDGVNYRECTTWRDGAIDHINAADPALVVLASSGEAVLGTTAVDRGQAWEEALGITLDRLPSRTVLLADTPRFAQSVPVCLSVHPDDAMACAETRESAVDATIHLAERRAALAREVAYVDTIDYLCDDSVCGPVVGSTLLYRDDDHLTATWSRALAPALGGELSAHLEQSR